MILKGLNQQVGNHQTALEPLSIHTAFRVQSIWEEETSITSILDVSSQDLAEQLTLIEAEFHSRVSYIILTFKIYLYLFIYLFYRYNIMNY